MHSCEPAPPPPATGARLLLELGQLIISSRQGSPQRAPTPPAKEDSSYHRILQAKLLAARNLTPGVPSTSKAEFELRAKGKEETGVKAARSAHAAGAAAGAVKPGLDAASVGEAVCKAQRSLLLEAQLSSHIQELWSERIPICIDVYLAGDCRQCASPGGSREHPGAPGGPRDQDTNRLLLERWTLSMLISKANEPPTHITSQWLLNAVRSQLHFSQISAWHAKLKAPAAAGGGGREPAPLDPHERQRKLSRETCNYKKLESNCDDEDLPRNDDQEEQRKLNIVYSVKAPGDSYAMAEFSRTPNRHVFPLTDIGGDACLKVTLESLPRVEDVPILKCACPYNNPPKRRMSKEFAPLNLPEELTARMNDLTLGPPENRPDHYRAKGATFSPDLGVINSNTGSSSGISRKLSIYSLPGAETSYSGSTRVSTPERQFYNDSGYPDSCVESPAHRGSPSKEIKKSIQLDHPYFKQSLSLQKDTVTNYLLVDDRMHTPCSESGKHRCSCDDESDQGKEYPRSSTSLRKEDEGKKLDDRRLKEIAKYKRRLRKESKLKKMHESQSDSAGTSECAEHRHDKEDPPQTTSIPILQASRFDRMRAIGCYRNQTYLTLPANRFEDKGFKDAACDTIDTTVEAPKADKSMISIATQTDELVCNCGGPLELKCDPCEMRKIVRSEASYDLARINQSDILLEAMERTCQLHSPGANRTKESNTRRKVRDEACCDDEKVMKKHKCDSNVSVKCDFSLSDSLSCGVRKYPDDDSGQYIIKRPKLKRFLPVVDRIGKVISERKMIDDTTSNDIDELLLKDDDSVFACAAKSHSTPKGEDTSPLNRTRSSISDDEYMLYEKCDYGTFDRFENSENLVPEAKSEFDSDDGNSFGSWRNGIDLCGSQLELKPSDLKRNGPTLNGSKRNAPSTETNTPSSDTSGSSTDIANSSSADSNLNRLTKADTERSKPSMEHIAIPSTSEMEVFRWRFDSAASMVFHTRTGLPLTSSPAPLRKGKSCFDYDSSITGISGIRSALFHPVSPSEGWWSPGSSPGSPAPPGAAPLSPPLAAPLSPPRRPAVHGRAAGSRGSDSKRRLKVGTSTGLLGSFEESALNGRLEPTATVHGFTAELGASGAFCPPHRRLPVTVFFYALGGTAAPYLGHINLGAGGYRVPRSGTVQVSLFNPHGTLVKMFVVLYELTDMPASCKTFLRQRTLHTPCGERHAPPPARRHNRLRYLIHLRFLTSKSGKLYLHTDIRIIVSRKADLDTATAHSPIYNSIKHNTANQGPTVSGAANQKKDKDEQPNQVIALNGTANQKLNISPNKMTELNGSVRLKSECNDLSNEKSNINGTTDQKVDLTVNGASDNRLKVNRVFGGCDDEDMDEKKTYDYKSAKSDHDFLTGRKMNRSEACMELSVHCDQRNDSNQRNYCDQTNDLCNQTNDLCNLSNHSSNRNNDLCIESNDTVGVLSQNVSYELRSFTYAPDNPKYSPR